MITKKQMTEQQALKKLADLCARGEHCSGDVIDKMRRWGIAEDARERVLQRLIDGKYIDDERYTHFFVNDKIKYNKWGRRKIEQALWLKHVSPDIIGSVLDEVDDEDYLAVLRPLIRQKMETVNAASDYERAMKTIKWAMGRGFSMELIRKCIDQADEYAED